MHILVVAELILEHQATVVQADKTLRAQLTLVVRIAETQDIHLVRQEVIQGIHLAHLHLEVVRVIQADHLEVILDILAADLQAHLALEEAQATLQAVDHRVAAVLEEAVRLVLAHDLLGHQVHVRREVEDNQVVYEKVDFNFGTRTPLVI